MEALGNLSPRPEHLTRGSVLVSPPSWCGGRAGTVPAQRLLLAPSCGLGLRTLTPSRRGLALPAEGRVWGLQEGDGAVLVCLLCANGYVIFWEKKNKIIFSPAS